MSTTLALAPIAERPTAPTGRDAPAPAGYAPPCEPWNAAATLPAPGLDDGSLLAAAVRQAVLAPSSHNTQPWRFVLRLHPTDGRGPALELYADRTRALPVVDPHDRALVISCGAALAHVRVALAAAGRHADVVRLPDASEPDLLARVRVGPARDASVQDVARFAAIANRRTTRLPFAPQPLPAALLDALAEVARVEQVELHAVTDLDDRATVAGFVAEGDRRQADDPAFRRELAAWLHPTRARTRDGIPTAAFGVPDLVARPFPWVIRTFDWGDGQAARDRQLAEGAPALLVLATRGDGPPEWLRTGEALGLVLLDLTVDGYTASFLNQPVEVPALRPALADALGLAAAPQLVLRVGVAPAVPPTPRRLVDDVFELR